MIPCVYCILLYSMAYGGGLICLGGVDHLCLHARFAKLELSRGEENTQQKRRHLGMLLVPPTWLFSWPQLVASLLAICCGFWLVTARRRRTKSDGEAVFAVILG